MWRLSEFGSIVSLLAVSDPAQNNYRTQEIKEILLKVDTFETDDLFPTWDRSANFGTPLACRTLLSATNEL
jgi:hypothetical protein